MYYFWFQKYCQYFSNRDGALKIYVLLVFFEISLPSCIMSLENSLEFSQISLHHLGKVSNSCSRFTGELQMVLIKPPGNLCTTPRRHLKIYVRLPRHLKTAVCGSQANLGQQFYNIVKGFREIFEIQNLFARSNIAFR
jgi:hypothetical protein